MKNRIVRRLAMVILCVMTFTVVYSQAESHVQFMGIPINGSADYFCAQLLKKGFVKEGNHYTGDVSELTAWVGPLIDNGIFYGVHVSFADTYYDFDESTIINEFVLVGLRDTYDLEFVENEPSDPAVKYVCYAITEDGMFVDIIQEVREHQYGVDVDIIDLANAQRAGFINW